MIKLNGMENKKNMKVLIISLMSMMLVVIGVYFFNQNNTVEITQDVNSDVIDKIKIENFGDLAEFIKDDLTEEETKNLKDILIEKDIKIEEVKMVLKEAFESEDGSMEEAFGALANILEKIKESIIPFIKPEKIKSFDIYFMDLGATIEVEFIGK